LRISFWAGALIDALAAIQMLFPRIFAAANQLSNFSPAVEYRFAMGTGASLMLGILRIMLIVLFGFSYWNASSTARERR